MTTRAWPTLEPRPRSVPHPLDFATLTRSCCTVPKQFSTEPKYRVEVFVPARQGIRTRDLNSDFRSVNLLVRAASALLCAASTDSANPE